MTGHAYTDKQIALAMLAVDDPLQWGRLGADNKLMLRQFVDALSGADRERAITGEPVAKYDDVLVPFMALMRRELHANSAKGDRPGWLSMPRDTALLEIYWHAAKLSAAVKNNDAALIAEHSADVANMAMMLLDVCSGLTGETSRDVAAEGGKA